MRQDRARATAITVTRSKVIGRNRCHVAIVALIECLLGRVPTLRAKARRTAEQERVEMILATDESIVVECFGQEHFVTGAAELARAMHFRLEIGVLVKRGLRLDQLSIHPLQQRRLAEGERILRTRFDRVVGVASIGIDTDDAVATCAADARATQWISAQVVERIIPLCRFETSREERHWIMAACAESCVLHAAFALERLLSSLTNAGCVERIVERTRSVRR